MKKFTAGLLLVLSCVFIQGLESKEFNGNGRMIQIALLLDTSSSMDGLIDQAKTELWRIVNEMSRAKKGGQNAHIQVALYEYGKSSLPSAEGYMRMISPFTGDLDRISEELFKLSTNGGEEFCGRVIDESIRNLVWDRSPGSMKMIFIAGNEPFNQGNVDFRGACADAVSKGIVVNTIFCGNKQEGINTKWKEGADLADGTYSSIDHNQVAVDIAAPQDTEILKLNRELNQTYIAYGSAGAAKKERQRKQDANAGAMSEMAIVERSVAKASVHYKNSSWDLVDAVSDKEVDLEKVKRDTLPEELRGKTPGEIRVYVEKKKKDRDRIQKRIALLNRERQQYIEKELKRRAVKDSLGSTLVKSLRGKALKKGFTLD